MFSEMSYHVRRLIAFRTNDQYYGHISGIICSNDFILRPRVHLEMMNNVAEGGFHFLCTKKYFLFYECKHMGFMKSLPNLCRKIGPV